MRGWHVTDNGASQIRLPQDLFGTAAYGGTNNQGVVFELIFKNNSYTYKRIYNFCYDAGCSDGASPGGTLAIDTNGNVYGTTLLGGTANNCGTVFELSPNGPSNSFKTKWKFHALFALPSSGSTCPQGSYPQGVTYEGADTNSPYDGTSPLFIANQTGGYTDQSACSGCGTVGRLVPPTPPATKWKWIPIYTFCDGGSGPICSKGQWPWAILSDAGASLYGVASGGNPPTPDYYTEPGVVFKLSANATKTAWTYQKLYNFCSDFDPNKFICPDGYTPVGQLVLDPTGTLYGVAAFQGDNNSGVVFQLNPGTKNYTYTRLYSFCPGATSCPDGITPSYGLAEDPNGFLYGVTTAGGKYGLGVVFQISPNGVHSAEVPLYDFCRKDGTCPDGGEPASSLIVGSGDNLFGTAAGGGSYNGGVVYKLHP